MSAWKANQLRRLRFDRGISQQEVARRLGISQAQYSNFERAYAEPDSDTKGRIAKILRVPVADLLPPPDQAVA